MSRIFGLHCPTNPGHGLLYPWPGARGWFCSHQAHGANGRFFTTAEAEAARPAPQEKASLSV